MDLFTQAVLGAATSHTVAKPADSRTAVITGGIAGLLPDADILIRSNSDPLLVLEFHRHFTHSLLFIPVGAAIAAGLVWLFCRDRCTYKRLYIYALPGIALAGLLDACTSYGTLLLWPFSNQRIAWNLIAIVDPVFTLLLLVPLIIAIRRRSNVPARFALLCAAAYLGLAAVQLQRATAMAEALIAARGHQVERLLVKPTMANLVLWRSVYIAGKRIHADALRAGIFAEKRVYPGDSVALLIPGELSSIPPDTRAAQDLRRFAVFSDGWLAPDPTRQGLIGDLRYAMLPNSIIPLWGVLLTHNDFSKPLPFVTNREFTPAMRHEFMRMLTGE